MQGGRCVQTGSAASLLPIGAGRIPQNGWVERRGEDCRDASSGAGRGLRGDRNKVVGLAGGSGRRCGGPAKPRFLGLCRLRGTSPTRIRPPFNSSSSEKSSSCDPLPHQLCRWKGKKLPQVRWSELAACESLNSKTEEEVGFDWEWVLIWDGWTRGEGV